MAKAQQRKIFKFSKPEEFFAFERQVFELIPVADKYAIVQHDPEDPEKASARSIRKEYLFMDEIYEALKDHVTFKSGAYVHPRAMYMYLQDKNDSNVEYVVALIALGVKGMFKRVNGEVVASAPVYKDIQRTWTELQEGLQADIHYLLKHEKYLYDTGDTANQQTQNSTTITESQTTETSVQAKEKIDINPRQKISSKELNDLLLNDEDTVEPQTDTVDDLPF